MRFVVLGDLHYSIYPDAANCALREEFFDRLFTSVAKQQPDVVIAIGDTTDNGYSEEFEGLHRAARRNKLEFVTVNGNHDVLEMSKPEISRYTGNRFPYFALYFNPLTGLSDVTDHEAARFLIIDTPKERSPKDHGGYVGPEQLAWLENQIAESEDKPLFIFGHHPLTHATRWSSFPMLSINNSKEVKRLLAQKRQGAAFYFCGHNHANSIDRRGNWNYIQTAAPLRSGDYRVIDFRPEEVRLQTITFEGGRELGQRLAQALGDFTNFPSRGFRLDRELRLKLAHSKVLVQK